LRGRSKRRTTEQNSQSPSADLYSSPSSRQSSSKKNAQRCCRSPLSSSPFMAAVRAVTRPCPSWRYSPEPSFSMASLGRPLPPRPRADAPRGRTARDRAGDVASRRRTEPISQIEGVSWRGLEAPRTPPPYAATSGVARAVVCLAGRLGIHLLFLSNVCLLFFPNFSLMPNT
jgi:hypothetical protein